mmetsp:Transcript_12997/g.36566  ORF Transcript_12997/g.36566 Transcript_12997/m.36566 type:complete len:262 (+) Transcript_12997:1375-2160(+)
MRPYRVEIHQLCQALLPHDADGLVHAPRLGPDISLAGACELSNLMHGRGHDDTDEGRTCLRVDQARKDQKGGPAEKWVCAHLAFGELYAIDSQECQACRANQCRGAGDSSSCGDVSVHHDLEAHNVDLDALGCEVLVHTLVGTHDVVPPGVVCSFDALLGINVKVDVAKPLLLKVGDVEAFPTLTNGHHGVIGDGHGENTIALVVDVLTNKVDASWGSPKDLWLEIELSMECGVEAVVPVLVLGQDFGTVHSGKLLELGNR